MGKIKLNDYAAQETDLLITSIMYDRTDPPTWYWIYLRWRKKMQKLQILNDPDGTERERP